MYNQKVQDKIDHERQLDEDNETEELSVSTETVDSGDDNSNDDNSTTTSTDSADPIDMIDDDDMTVSEDDDAMAA